MAPTTPLTKNAKVMAIMGLILASFLLVLLLLVIYIFCRIARRQQTPIPQPERSIGERSNKLP